MRWPLLALALLAPAAARAESGWTFKLREPYRYTYELVQTTAFESAGDKLEYVTRLSWQVVFVATESAPERARLSLTFLHVAASMSGPGTKREIDSAAPTPDAQRDPLLGHLLELDGKHLELVLDPRTGVVSEVSGGDAIAEAIAKREPSKFGPGEPSPLEAQARAAFSSEALSRLWSQLLASPGGEQRIELAAPIAGAVVRRWTGTTYALALPTGTDHLDVTVGREPLSIAGRATNLTGGGAVTPKDGVPGAAEGHLEFDLALTALTQPVTEHQRVVWKLTQEH
jgi:hypothetical protein